MSAALQFPNIARAAAAQRQWQATRHYQAQPEIAPPASSHQEPRTRFGPASSYRPGFPPEIPYPNQADLELQERPAPPPNLAFYRKHTETLLRRYLYASMLVGRSPSMLTEPMMRGRASSRVMKTFEDCVIFVLDMEKALAQVSALERLLITRVVLQEYSVAETALLLNKGHRIVFRRLSDAVDKLTGILLDNGTLKIPNPRRSAQTPDSSFLDSPQTSYGDHQEALSDYDLDPMTQELT